MPKYSIICICLYVYKGRKIVEMLQITLKSARVNKNMTQSEVVKILGISKHTILNWENDKTKIPVYAKKYLALIYNIDFDNLK